MLLCCIGANQKSFSFVLRHSVPGNGIGFDEMTFDRMSESETSLDEKKQRSARRHQICLFSIWKRALDWREKSKFNSLSMELFSRRRWSLISAQLSNKFDYCPLYTVSIVLCVHKHNNLLLGQIRAFISRKLLCSQVGYFLVSTYENTHHRGKDGLQFNKTWPRKKISCFFNVPSEAAESKLAKLESNRYSYSYSECSLVPH